MAAKLIVVALALAAVLTAEEGVAQVRSINLEAPRPFGYLIGDVIRLQVDVTLDEAFSLLPASLPKARSVNYWLDLKSIVVDDLGTRGGQHRYRLILDYQTFYSPLAPTPLEIPGFTLTATDGTTQAEGEVPGWRFLTSPLREITRGKADKAVTLRDDREPQLLSTLPYRSAALASGVGMVLLLGMLAHHRAWWPFKEQRKRPFARATRAVQDALTKGGEAEGYLHSLLSLHRAFDTTAGRRILADDVPAFLERWRAFRPLQSDIGRFFEASRRAFFGSDSAGAMTTLPPEALTALGKRLAAAERSAS
jgi:mxaA protein